MAATFATETSKMSCLEFYYRPIAVTFLLNYHYYQLTKQFHSLLEESSALHCVMIQNINVLKNLFRYLTLHFSPTFSSLNRKCLDVNVLKLDVADLQGLSKNETRSGTFLIPSHVATVSTF